jgi:hypothetical protein
MFSIGAHGHVNPSLPVIAELVAHGHRVSYAVPKSFARIAASAGAAPVVYHSVLPGEKAGQRRPDGGVEAMSIFLDEAEQALPMRSCGWRARRRWQPAPRRYATSCVPPGARPEPPTSSSPR